jgi:hypothetical protein
LTTEFALPHLFIFFGWVSRNLRFVIEDTLASLAYFSITSGDFGIFGQGVQVHLENIGVDFNVMLFCFGFKAFLSALASLCFLHEKALLSVIFIVTHVQFTVKVVVVDRFTRQVSV